MAEKGDNRKKDRGEMYKGREIDERERQRGREMDGGRG